MLTEARHVGAPVNAAAQLLAEGGTCASTPIQVCCSMPSQTWSAQACRSQVPAHLRTLSEMPVCTPHPTKRRTLRQSKGLAAASLATAADAAHFSSAASSARAGSRRPVQGGTRPARHPACRAPAAPSPPSDDYPSLPAFSVASLTATISSSPIDDSTDTITSAAAASSFDLMSSHREGFESIGSLRSSLVVPSSQRSDAKPSSSQSMIWYSVRSTLGTERLWDEGTRSSIFFPVKMSTATKWHFA
mmetsp:Transcript_9397/g.24320  ORF Transcript_9397/g.24320 Transcript_9397/m.24320 type:complete len:246 (+) Transcript_9397:250-987(+)